MKQTFKRLSLLVVLALGALVLVGCKTTVTTTEAPITDAPTTTAEVTTQKQDLNALGNFAASVDGVYTVALDSASGLHFTYAKGTNAGAYLQKSVSNLGGFNTLAITVAAAGTFKIELVAGEDTLAVSISSTSAASVYNWNLKNDQEVLANVTELRIYAAPDKEAATGELNFTVLNFTTTLAGAAGEFIINTGDNRIPTNTIDYDGSDEVNILAKFQNNDEGVYAFTYNADGSTTIDYSKAGYSWAYFYNEFTAMPSSLTLLKLVVKGTAGTQILVKPDDNVGGDNWYTIQTTDAEETVYIPIPAGVSKILFFVNPNSEANGTVTFVSGTISAGTVTKTEAGAVVSGYVDNGDGKYTITENAGVASVAYDLPAGGWSYFQAFTSSKASAGLGTLCLKVTVNGVAGAQVLVKLNNQLETWYTIQAADTDESFLITGDKLPVYLERILVFINGGAAAATTGTMDLKIEVVETPVEQTTVEYDGESAIVDANGYWVDGGNSAFTFVQNEDNSYTVTVNKVNSQYAYFKNEYTGFDDVQFVEMILVVKGTAGDQLGFKPNDSNDYMEYLTFNGEVQMFVFDIPADMAKLIIFFNINDASATGEFTIYSLEMIGEADTVTGFTSNDEGVYTISEGEEYTSVAYAKTGAWQFMGVSDLSIPAGSVLGIMVKGTEGDTILIKLNDDNAYQTTVTLNGDVQVIYIDSVPASITSVYMFVNGSASEGSGSFIFTMGYFESPKPVDTNKYVSGDSFDVNHYWQPNDVNEGAYTVADNGDGTFTVTALVAKGQWSCFITKTSGITDSDFQYVKLVVTGVAGSQILIKPNDASEVWVNLTGESQIIYAPIAVKGNDFTKVVIFIAPGASITETQDLVITSCSLVKGVLVSEDAYVTNFDTHETTTVSVDGNNVSLAFNHTSGDWKYVKAFVNGSSEGLVLQVTVTSSDASMLLVKLNDQLETWVTITDGSGSATISGEKLPADMSSILLFVDGGVAEASSGTAVVTLQWVQAPTE
ncbi:MAG: hypothetical protein H6687_02445 [Bacillales bacterium]|nr:hypothetical protein [Bacillales bacterium]